MAAAHGSSGARRDDRSRSGARCGRDRRPRDLSSSRHHHAHRPRARRRRRAVDQRDEHRARPVPSGTTSSRASRRRCNLVIVSSCPTTSGWPRSSTRAAAGVNSSDRPVHRSRPRGRAVRRRAHDRSTGRDGHRPPRRAQAEGVHATGLASTVSVPTRPGRWRTTPSPTGSVIDCRPIIGQGCRGMGPISLRRQRSGGRRPESRSGPARRCVSADQWPIGAAGPRRLDVASPRAVLIAGPASHPRSRIAQRHHGRRLQLVAPVVVEHGTYVHAGSSTFTSSTSSR